MKNKFTVLIKEKATNKRFLIGTVIFLFLAIFMIFSKYGVIKRFELEMQKKEILRSIENEKRTNDSLHNQIKLLEYDKNEIEKIAREKYGMIKPGERVFIKKPETTKSVN